MYDSKKIYVLYAVSFLDLFAIGLTVPLLTNHVRDLGGSHFIAGLLGSIYSGIQLFSGPIVGSWSDLKGRRPVLILTLILSCACYFILGVTSSLLALFAIRIILGFTKHTQTLCKALISDVVPQEKQSAIFGYSTAISTLGFVIGPAIGGHLSESSNGFLYVCLLTSFLFVVNIGLVFTINTVQKSGKTRKKASSEIISVTNQLKQVQWGKYWDIFSMKFLHAFAVSIYFSNYSLLLKEYYGISQKSIGYTISFQSSIGTIIGFLTETLNKLLYKPEDTQTKRHFHLFVMFTLSFVFIYFSPNFQCFLLSLIPLAASNSLLRIVETDVVISRSTDDKGSLVGASNSISSLARLGAPLISGLVSDIWGENNVICLAIIVAMLGMSIAWNLYSKEKQQKNKKL